MELAFAKINLLFIHFRLLCLEKEQIKRTKQLESQLERHKQSITTSYLYQLQDIKSCSRKRVVKRIHRHPSKKAKGFYVDHPALYDYSAITFGTVASNCVGLDERDISNDLVSLGVFYSNLVEVAFIPHSKPHSKPHSQQTQGD